MHNTLQCIASLLFLQFVLALNVTRVRAQTKTMIGAKDDPADSLHKARVAHSNACEYIPALCLLMMGLQWVGSGDCLAWLFRAAVLVRFVHAAGIVIPERLDRRNPLRFSGAAGTYAIGLFMAGYLFCHC